MHLKFQCAERVGDAFDGVAQAVGEVIHWVDWPGVSGAVVVHAPDPIQGRVSHVYVGGRHVDFGAQGFASVFEFTGAHACEEVEIFFHGPIAVGAFFTGTGGCSTCTHEIFGRKIADEGFAGSDQVLSKGVEFFKVIGCKKLILLPIESQPADVFLDGVHIFGVFAGWVGIVESQVAGALIFLRNAKVQADGLGVSYVQVAVGFRWEPGDDMVVLARGEVALDDLADKVQ